MDLPDLHLPKVTLQSRLGHGGMASVFLGHHRTLDRPVAVKILHAHLVEDERVLERFRLEAQAVAALRHPSIVQIYDFDIVDGRPYIVMELIEGLALAERLQANRRLNQKMPPATILRLTEDVAAALDHAHAAGIVHRDVKPANILLRSTAGRLSLETPLPATVQAVLTDFGIARLTHAATLTATGTMLGTPAYMGPEQVVGGRVDARTDLYALGVVVYELITDRLPFEPDLETPASVLFKHVHDQPPPVPDGSPELQAVFETALAKDPEARFPTAGALAQALRAALADGSRQARPRPAAAPIHGARAVSKAAGASSRRRILLPGLVLLTALVVAGAAALAGGDRVKLQTPTPGLSILEPSASAGATAQTPALATTAPPAAATPTSEAPTTVPASSPAALPSVTDQPTRPPRPTAAPTSTPPPPATATPTPLLPLPTLDLGG